MSELLVVCVPGARLDTTSGLLRLVLVPRLTGPANTLTGYGLQNWPALIRGATFEIRLRADAGTAPQALTATVQSDAQDDVWAGFFGPSATVVPYTGQSTYQTPVVDSATWHAEQIGTAYQAAAVGIGSESIVRDQYKNLDLTNPQPLITDPGSSQLPMPNPDFHRTIAMLREHPRVLRALGLIVDVNVPRTALTQTGTTGNISATWSGAPAGVGAVVSPWSAYDLSSGHFLPSSTRVIVNGLVNLRTTSAVVERSPDGTRASVQKPDWVVTTVDVDSAVARLTDAKTAIESGSATTEVSLPALRTVGLMLMHRAQGAMLAARASRGRSNANRASVADAPPLTADDLLLGYRLDVKPRGDDWHSLTQRRATYTVGTATVGAGGEVEEGHSKPAVAVLHPSSNALLASEAVVRWDGWSLAVPREPLQSSGPGPQRIPALPYDFRPSFELDPTGTPLPTLLFGSSYQLRVRAVDLAGGGLALTDPVGDTAATDPVLYGRLEPIASPVLPTPPGLLDATLRPPVVDYTLLGPGGALDVLVIRSDPAGTPTALTSTYPANDTRTMLPPPMTLAIADQHGALDAADAPTWANVRRAMAAPRADFDATGSPTYSWLPDQAAKGIALAPFWQPGQAAAFADQRDWDTANWPTYQPKQLQLIPAGDDSVLINWANATLGQVAVPAGRQVTVEISSTMQNLYLDRFAAGAWLAEHKDAADAVYAGRHPVITPARSVLMVHAVRRPLAVPHGLLAPTRSPAETSVTLADTSQPLLGIDSDSTAELDIGADWDEWDDSGQPAPTSAVVQTLPVARTDTALPAIRQEFGDTRHRAVTYRLTARSRFRQYFDATEPDDAFAATGQTQVVHVPSSARPAAPVVLSAVPAFEWETIHTATVTTRIRRGGRIRIELAAPWFATGQDEMLGLIVAPDLAASLGVAPLDTDDWNLLSTAYRDPTSATSPVAAQPTTSSYRGAVGPTAVLRDQESGRDVTVLPYAVWYANQRRFTDIAVDGLADATYMPMMTLSVARYQPFSLPGLALSPLTRTDYIPLLPTRTLTVTRTAAGLVIALTGTGPSGPPHRVDIRLESRPTDGSQPSADELTAITAPNSGSAWQPDNLTQTTLNTPSAPLAIDNDGRLHRLVVQESAGLDQSSAAATGLTTDDPLAAQLSERIVFADVIIP